MNFQRILMIFFGFMAVIAIVVFSAFPSKSQSDPKLKGAQGNVSIWGTFPSNEGIQLLTKNFNDEYKGIFSISYSYHDPASFDTDIVEALASGRGPDVLLLPNDLILRHADKIEMIPYTMIPQRDFSTTFIQSAEIYLRQNGIIAVPYAVDPLVLYWNREIFNNTSVTLPPVYWDEVLDLTPKFTKRDQKTQDITQSAIAFGEYANVVHAKDIISMLFLQVGNNIVSLSSTDVAKVDLSKEVASVVTPDQDVVSAFRYFMDFSNPSKNIYTWSRALPNSRDLFLEGKLAMYIDYASAYKELKQKNPHLNFEVAPVPQTRDASSEITFARLHGLAVLKSSKNRATAFIAIQKLLTPTYSGLFSDAFNLPPVRRDLLAKRPSDVFLSVTYDAAIRARTWLDPRPELSEEAFKGAVESVSSGLYNAQNAVDFLNEKLSSALAAL